MFEKFQLLEKMYFHELERKQQLESSTSLPIGVVVACYGLLGYFFTHYRFEGTKYYGSRVAKVLFEMATLVSVSLLALATYWCIRVVMGSTYEYLPGSQTLHNYVQGLERWHKNNRTRNPTAVAKAEFQEFLAKSLAKCSQTNWQTNLVRSEELYRAKRFTVFALIGLAFAAIAYYVDFWFEAPQITNTNGWMN